MLPMLTTSAGIASLATISARSISSSSGSATSGASCMAALATLRSRSYIAVSITSAGDSGSLDRDLLCFISNTSNLVCLERGRLRRASERENGSTRSEEHTSELQSLMRTSYAVLCFKKKHKSIHTLTTKHIEH